ncbi:MAG: nucleoside 2-deoxyribosyltransferase [Candidatus Hodarchaeales archaeon]|jgi:hypothetical protein
MHRTRRRKKTDSELLKKLFALVLMPFSDDFKDIYTLGIKQAAKQLNITVERVDEQRFTKTILENLYDQIKKADIIIADLSGLNPNVYYELGYAHALGKLCILLNNNEHNVPFDLKHYPHIFYDSYSSLYDKLIKDLKGAKQEVYKNLREEISLKLHPKSNLKKKIFKACSADIYLYIIIYNSSETPIQIRRVDLYTKKDWKFISNYPLDSQPDSPISPFKFQYCLNSVEKLLSKDSEEIIVFKSSNHFISSKFKFDINKSTKLYQEIKNKTLRDDILIRITTSVGVISSRTQFEVIVKENKPKRR